MVSKTCCFTGHREIAAGELEKIVTRLRYRVEELCLQGYRYFGVGGAVGFDTVAAKWLLEYKKTHSNIRIIEVLPFPGYRNAWTDEQKYRASIVDQKVDKIVYCCDRPSRNAFLVRDRHLVDCSSVCISYCTRTTGGTAYTVKYALKHGVPVYNTSSFDVSTLLK